LSFGFLAPWHVFLPRDGGHIVGLMGSGGKTSLLQELAAVYTAEGVETVLTTTTRCEILPGVAALSWAELGRAAPAGLPSGVFVHAGRPEPDKWIGLTAAQVDSLGEIFPDRVVLVEVDGAAKHPLKLYRDGEPVWPSHTSLALVVMGVGAVGAKASTAVHRWGDVAFAPWVGLPDYTGLEWSHLRSLLLADQGYLAQVPNGVPAALALTGLAEQDDAIGLFEFVGQAMAGKAVPLVMFCSREDGQTSWQIRTAYAEKET